MSIGRMRVSLTDGAAVRETEMALESREWGTFGIISVAARQSCCRDFDARREQSRIFTVSSCASELADGGSEP